MGARLEIWSETIEAQMEWIEALWNEVRIERIAIKDGIAFVPAFLIAFAVLIW